MAKIISLRKIIQIGGFLKIDLADFLVEI